MFNHFFLKMSTALRTRSGLMLHARRILREAIRDEKELDEVIIKKIKEEADAGDVDEVVKTYEEAVKTWERVREEIAKEEGEVVMGEERVIEHLHDILPHLDRAIGDLRKLDHETVQKYVALLTETRNDIFVMFTDERAVLKDEYNVLLREAEGKEGTIQNFVFSFAQVMETMDKLWDERKEMRKVINEAKDLDGIITKFVVSIEKNVKADQRQLAHDCEAIHALAKNLHKHVQVSLKTFLFLLKSMVDLWFQFGKEDAVFHHLTEDLQSSGFPTHELEELKEDLKHAEDTPQGKVDMVVKAFRRMARIEQSDMPIAA